MSMERGKQVPTSFDLSGKCVHWVAWISSYSIHVHNYKEDADVDICDYKLPTDFESEEPTNNEN